MGGHPPLAPYRFTRAEYDRMVDSGALEDLPIELLDGELVEVSPQGPAHAAAIQALMRWFAPRVELLRIQMPLAATDDSEPEPDVALVAHTDVTDHPPSALLAVEVVVSQHRAAKRKAPIYARAAVAEYWIVDVPQRRVVQHRHPAADCYGEVTVLAGSDELQPPAGLSAMTVAALFASAGLD